MENNKPYELKYIAPDTSLNSVRAINLNELATDATYLTSIAAEHYPTGSIISGALSTAQAVTLANNINYPQRASVLHSSDGYFSIRDGDGNTMVRINTITGHIESMYGTMQGAAELFWTAIAHSEFGLTSAHDARREIAALKEELARTKELMHKSVTELARVYQKEGEPAE